MAIKSTKNIDKKKSKKEKDNKKLPESQSREISAIIMYTVSLIILFTLSWTAWWFWDMINTFFMAILWIWSYIMPIFLIIFASYLFFVQSIKFHYHRILWVVLFYISILWIIHLNVDLVNAYDKLSEYWWILGFIFSTPFRMWFWDIITWIIFISLFLISIQLIISISFKELYQIIFAPISDVEIKRWDLFDDAEVTNTKTWKKWEQLELKEAELDIIKPKQIENNKENNLKDKNDAKESSENTQWWTWMTIKRKQDQWIKVWTFSDDDEWQLPSLDLLCSDISNVYPDDELLKKQADIIKEKLSQFWILVEVVSARVWPTVTQFTLKPNEWIKVARILSYKDDLAMALSAKSIRMQAPIPGQPFVWIETPNKNRATVYMREILTSTAFTSIWKWKMRLTFGKDVAWNAIVEDLEIMPHLLIAWSTGSWKSVCMNSFLISLLYQNSPKELRFIMIDPKLVELWMYWWIPHLLTPIITEADRALSSLKWAVSEMMRRYAECKDKWYKNLKEYNTSEEKKMPRIVIVIDELADLMMREFRKETEAAICRLAQMARAVWIHLLIATQRPSVNVVTWLIKANIPTRISFKLVSWVDSRTILDSIWAEELLWYWDMLYINSTNPVPQRIQWIYISTKEIQDVTNYIKLAKEPESDEWEMDIIENNKSQYQWVWDIDLDAISAATNEDEKVPEAIEIIRRSGKASATILQRMLSVWYARAAKILDILESKWMIWPANWAKPRDVYWDKIWWKDE